MDVEKKFVGKWIIWLWIIWLTVVIISAGILIFGARSVGLVGQTAVERVIFEQSYQKQAGDEARENTLRAELASVNAMLRDGTVSAAMKTTLRGKKAALEIQLSR